MHCFTWNEIQALDMLVLDCCASFQNEYSFPVPYVDINYLYGELHAKHIMPNTNTAHQRDQDTDIIGQLFAMLDVTL